MARRAPWSIEDIPSQTGRTVVITGATSGIGYATAKVLADRGARVVIAARNEAKAAETVARIGGATETRPLDLADLDSVRAFAAGWDEPIDILINNAGVMAVPLRRTAQGFELQFGTNHLGHFALTNLLLPKIADPGRAGGKSESGGLAGRVGGWAGGSGRVVCVASTAHRMGHIDLADLNWEHKRYQQWPAYGQSKLANLLFVLELQRRLSAAGSAVRALAAHPGWARTNLQGHSSNPIADRAALVITRAIAQPAAHGAWPTLCAATADLPGGSYVGPGQLFETRGQPQLVGRSAEASDPRLAAELWTASEQLTGVGFPL